MSYKSPVLLYFVGIYSNGPQNFKLFPNYLHTFYYQFLGGHNKEGYHKSVYIRSDIFQTLLIILLKYMLTFWVHY